MAKKPIPQLVLSRSERRRSRTVASRLERWFESNYREFPWRVPGVPIYQLVVTEVLLQRTRAETVAAFYQAFFSRYPSWQSIADSSTACLEEALKPIGIWRRRAATLNALARAMVLLDGDFPPAREDIDTLPGVGQYVGNAIELLVHGRPRPLLDTNMARVLERYFKPRVLADIRHDPWLQLICQELVEIAKDPLTLNWAILDLGAIVCKPGKPCCQNCPLRRGCRYRATS